MPPLPVSPISAWQPRVVCYFQTYHDNGEYTSLLPLITNPSGVTHVILAAIHVNGDPQNITLNSVAPGHEMYTQLWDEVVVLQDGGIKVLGMLGGAAKGTFARLDYSQSRTDIFLVRFEAYYAPLRDVIRRYSLDGLDLDVEEDMTLPGVCHLIDRLKQDFGQTFIITLAPVATGLMTGRPHLSGFDYHLLEADKGASIAWYNTQFYNGRGGIDNTAAYDEIIRCGWKPEKVVAGMLTHPRHGSSGYVPMDLSAAVLGHLVEKYPNFGGVMGWEFWKALPQEDDPWMWPLCMTLCMGMKRVRDTAIMLAMGQSLSRINMRNR